MGSTAKRAAIVTLVAGSLVVLALALWKIKVVIALLFLGFIISAAMRPGVDWLQRRSRVPRGFGVLIHYVVVAGAIALFLWLVVPPAIDQVQQAIGSTSLHQQATHSTGIKHEILAGIDKRLRRLPSGSALVHPARHGHEDGVRGADRDLLHVRGGGVLDLRARQDDRARARPDAPPPAAGRARHLGADRPEARRVRTRAAAADRLRGLAAVRRLLGDRPAVLDPDRLVRRRLRDRAGDRTRWSQAPSQLVSV